MVALLGPTASGKTDLGIAIAEAMDLAVLSIDSRQVYRGMDIGTAKPSPGQRARVRHELLDLSDPDQPINLQAFSRWASAAIAREHRRRGIALLVGGSGLYLQALTQGLQPPPVPPQPWLRAQLAQLGQPQAHRLLAAADPASAATIAPADAVRTQRALEILYGTGQLPSQLRQRRPPAWRVLELGLNPPDLAGRISQRTQQMYAGGLLEETAALLARFGPHCPLLETIGYGEARQVLAGSLEPAVALHRTEQRTRQYAKRQRTWFRRQHRPLWLTGPDSGDGAGRGDGGSGGADLLSRAVHEISRVLG